MEQSTSWEANSLSATQEVPRLIWNPKVHFLVHISPPLVPVLSQMHLVHTFPPYLPKILQCPKRLWSLPSFLSNGYQGLFPWGKAAGA